MHHSCLLTNRGVTSTRHPFPSSPSQERGIHSLSCCCLLWRLFPAPNPAFLRYNTSLGDQGFYDGMQLQLAGAAGTQSNIFWKSLEGAQERNFGTEKKGRVVTELVRVTFGLTGGPELSSLLRWWPEQAGCSKRAQQEPDGHRGVGQG